MSLSYLTNLSSVHLYLSFHGNNELRIENGSPHAIAELRRLVVTLWHPGVELDDIEGYIWRVRFIGSPWNLSGPDTMRQAWLDNHFIKL